MLPITHNYFTGSLGKLYLVTANGLYMNDHQRAESELFQEQILWKQIKYFSNINIKSIESHKYGIYVLDVDGKIYTEFFNKFDLVKILENYNFLSIYCGDNYYCVGIDILNKLIFWNYRLPNRVEIIEIFDQIKDPVKVQFHKCSTHLCAYVLDVNGNMWNLLYKAEDNKILFLSCTKQDTENIVDFQFYKGVFLIIITNKEMIISTISPFDSSQSILSIEELDNFIKLYPGFIPIALWNPNKSSIISAKTYPLEHNKFEHLKTENLYSVD